VPQEFDPGLGNDHTHNYDVCEKSASGGESISRCLICGDILRPDEAVICWDCRFANDVVGG